MPARVHALLVVRPDGRTTADIHLRRTLAALAAQTRPVDALTIVVCGADPTTEQIVAESGAEGVISTARGTRFADALRLASHRLDGDAVWLLAQDTAPEPEALRRLAGALETAPSVALAAPKLVRWRDRMRIVSLGVSVTRGGRAVELAAGELDQGQHDGTEDVLGVDVRGILVRAETWRELDGLDRALQGADEGLDLGVRARLAGGRVALAPTAIVAVAGDGVAGLAAVHTRAARTHGSFARRVAELHRRLAYAPGPAVAAHWIALLPLAVVRCLGHLLGKRPALIAPELAAAAVVAVRVPSVARSRARVRRARRVSWSQLAPLRLSGRQLRDRLDTDGDDASSASDLRFFGGGGAWIVLAALAVSLIAFPALLAWPVLGGGALAPLRGTVAQLWADALAGPRALGWSTTGPADPFSAVVATLGSLWPWAPSRALVALWVLALPLAALGGWFAATRLSERGLPRAVGAIGWALAPALLAALIEGRPTGVVVHLLLPWLLYTAVVAHRSWTSAAVASLLTAAVLACAPSLAPAAAALWVTAIVLTAVRRSGRGIARVIWLVVPTMVVFGPLVWQRLRAGEGWSLFADPGVVAASTPPADAVGRLLLAIGFPTADLGGWAGLLPEGAPIAWVPLLVAPVLVLAVLAPLLARPLPAAVLLVVAATGIVSAIVVAGVSLSVTGSTAVLVWTGAAVSLAWAGLLGSAVLTVDALPAARGTRIAAAAATLVCLAVLAVPSLTAVHRGTSTVVAGPASTLPAYVDAEGRGDPGIATLVLAAQPGGGVAAEVVWGGTAALGGQTTLQSARTDRIPGDEDTAAATADLVNGSAGDIVPRLAAHGIGYVLLDEPASDETDAARAMRMATTSALDRRDDLESVGDTGKGRLWLVLGEVAERSATAAQRADAARIGALQLGVVLIALLLAVPTRESLRAARRDPRTVGGERS